MKRSTYYVLKLRGKYWLRATGASATKNFREAEPIEHFHTAFHLAAHYNECRRKCPELKGRGRIVVRLVTVTEEAP